MPAGRAAVLSRPNVVNPGLTLLQNSTLWLDASDVVSGAQWVRNKGIGGRALDARLGSVGSAQIIDGALKLPGINGNYASVPWSPALEITGDIDIRICATPPNWQTANTGSPVVREGNGAGGNRAWAVWGIETTPAFSFWDSGGTQRDRNATATVPFTGSSLGWVRVTLDVDNGAGGHDVKWYTSTDGTNWTQLGSTITNAGTTSIDGTTTSLMLIGSTRAALNPFTGSIHRIQVRNGIDGVVAFDANFTTQSTLATSFTESSSNAATVTINSTTGVDTNDPLPLGHSGTNYLYVAGAGNAPTSPHIAAYSPSGVIDIRVRCSLDTWTTTQSIMSHYHSGSTGNWMFRTAGGSTFEFVVINGIGTGISYNSGAHGLTAGTTYWLRATCEAGGVTAFYYAADSDVEPSSWTQIGSNLASTHTDWRASACLLTVGARGSAGVTDPAVGKFYRAIYRNNTSTVAYDANFTSNANQNSFIESSSNTATVAINRALSGRKAVMVTRPVWLFGTDDFMDVADNALLDMGASQDFTIVSVVRTHASWGNDDRFISKRNNAGGLGYVLGNAASSGLIQFYTQHAGGSAVDTQTPYNIGTLSLISGVRSGSNITAFVGTTGSPTSGSAADLSNAVSFRIGADPDSANFLDGEVVAVVVFNSALDTTQLGHIASYYGV